MKMQQLRQEQNKSRKMFWSLAGLLDKKEKKELHLCIVFSVLSPLVDWGSMVALVLVFGRLSEPGIFRGLFGQVVFLGILDAIDTVYEKLEKKGIMLVSEPYEDIRLFHNRKWTVEVFVNLLENAIKYTQQGGTIQIKVCPYEIYTEIQIIDNGCGIHEEEITEIFKRFYRSREVEHIEGSGIGLYLSNLILEKEKGYMVVKSVYGEGSCFSVFLQNCKN